MTGLVLEGGTFRPIFSCGVMDALLSEKDYASLLHRQCQPALQTEFPVYPGSPRNLEIVQKYRNDKRYMSRQENFKSAGVSSDWILYSERSQTN